jgi:hypothetical protein
VHGRRDMGASWPAATLAAMLGAGSASRRRRRSSRILKAQAVRARCGDRRNHTGPVPLVAGRDLGASWPAATLAAMLGAGMHRGADEGRHELSNSGSPGPVRRQEEPHRARSARQRSARGRRTGGAIRVRPAGLGLVRAGRCAGCGARGGKCIRDTGEANWHVSHRHARHGFDVARSGPGGGDRRNRTGPVPRDRGVPEGGRGAPRSRLKRGGHLSVCRLRRQARGSGRGTPRAGRRGRAARCGEGLGPAA